MYYQDSYFALPLKEKDQIHELFSPIFTQKSGIEIVLLLNTITTFFFSNPLELTSVSNASFLN